MLSPSTAPRWKMQTRVFPPSLVRSAAYAARVRKIGSSPSETRASPPAFTNTRRSMLPEQFISVRLSAVRLLSLKLRAAEGESNGHGPRLLTPEIAGLVAQRLQSVLGRGTVQDRLVHRVNQRFAAQVLRDLCVQVDARSRNSAGCE